MNLDKKVLIIFIIVLLVVAGLVYWGSYNLGYKKGFNLGYDLGKKTGFDEGKEVGRTAAKTEAATAVTNPIEQIPSANPFEEGVNPFKELYQNPFK